MKLSFRNNFIADIGVDLGTSKIILYVKGKGVMANEPAVVAVNSKTGQILAVGKEASSMQGKTPPHIQAIKPLNNGVISDFEVTEKMLRYYFSRARDKNSFSLLPSWQRVVISVPSGGTEVEKRAVEDAARNAGAKEVYLVEEPLAVALGANIPIREARGVLIVDIGAGMTEVAVVSLGGIAVSRSLKIAGDKLDKDIVYYLRDRFKLMIGDTTAENIKLHIGSAQDLGSSKEMKVKGRDLTKGLPKEMKLKEADIREAITPSLGRIIDIIKGVIEVTPPELISDVMDSGIVLSGGTSLLPGLDKLIEKAVSLPVHIVEDPLTAVIRGIGIILEDINANKDLLLTISREKPPL